MIAKHAAGATIIGLHDLQYFVFSYRIGLRISDA
jgi:hypothetical protein